MPDNQLVIENSSRTTRRDYAPEEIDELIRNEIDELTEENNQIWSSPDHDRREYVHGFFQYPAMMVPVVQKKLIEIILSSKPTITRVLDPFMGSGTSLVACMENGLDCYGQDINPLAVLVSKTRTGPFYFAAIARKKESFFASIAEDRFTRKEARFSGLQKWFKDDVIQELSKIVRAIRREETPAIRRFYWVLLAETVRLTSNDRTSTFKLHSRPLDEIEERDLSPIEYFKAHYEKCLNDVEEYAELLTNARQLLRGSYIGKVNVTLADSKASIEKPAPRAGFHLVVTSPPYGDNKTTVTYGQHSYLPLQWIDLEDIDENATEDFLKTTSEIDSRGLGGKTQKINEAELALLFQASPTFEETYEQIALLEDKKRLNKVFSFFKDIFDSIKNIHGVLNNNGYQIWTVGNRRVGGVEIPNTTIMSEFICSHGAILVKSISREILNKRMASRNNASELMTFEDILIFRKTA